MPRLDGRGHLGHTEANSRDGVSRLPTAVTSHPRWRAKIS